MRRVSGLAAVALLAMLLSGCEYLIPGLYGDPGPWEDPGVTTIYESGRATLELDADGVQQTVVLDELSGGSELTGFGATVTWRNDEGWALTLSTFDFGGMPGMGGASGDLSIQRINGAELWVTDSYSNLNSCIVEIEESSDERLAGSATCRGLRWADGLGGFGGYSATGPRYIEGEPSFELILTFEARPVAGAHG
jgi:hypothetical protein